MLSLLFLPFRIVGGVLRAVFGILGGVLGIIGGVIGGIFGLIGGVVSLVWHLLSVGLIVGLIVAVFSRRKKSETYYVDDEKFTSYYNKK